MWAQARAALSTGVRQAFDATHRIIAVAGLLIVLPLLADQPIDRPPGLLGAVAVDAIDDVVELRRHRRAGHAAMVLRRRLEGGRHGGLQQFARSIVQAAVAIIRLLAKGLAQLLPQRRWAQGLQGAEVGDLIVQRVAVAAAAGEAVGRWCSM